MHLFKFKNNLKRFKCTQKKKLFHVENTPWSYPCFIPHYSISDHFPVCFTRKINCKISKSEHISTSYRCFKKFDETLFLTDLASDLDSLVVNESDIDEDFDVLYSNMTKHLDYHAPILKTIFTLTRLAYTRNITSEKNER